MKLTVTGKNITITDGIKQALETKFAKFDKFFDRDDVSGRVVMRTYPVGTKIEVTIFVPHMVLRAEVTDPDLYNAMDLAVEKLDGQLRKVKTRMEKKKSRPSLAEAIALEKIEQEKAKSESDEVVRAKSFYLEPMTLEEAITRMEAIGHDFFLYLDADEERVSVVYRRFAGGYGVLEAENKLK
ncbi:MAG: ribosome-associated translation inhibitor RaiA [Bacilli bacterium]|nr:ribosome-associated translation inhibitor RaiA [Bacilli bacterium]